MQPQATLKPEPPRGGPRLSQYQGTYCEAVPRGSKYPIIRYLGFWVIVMIVQVLGKYMIIGYLDP